MTKTKVRTILYLEDSKGWKNEIEWPFESYPPHNYQWPKRCPLDLIPVDKLSDMPTSGLNFVRFRKVRERIHAINDKFYDLYVYYEEEW